MERQTKIIIPSEIQNLAGLVTSIKEVAAQPEAVEKSRYHREVECADCRK